MPAHEPVGAAMPPVEPAARQWVLRARLAHNARQAIDFVPTSIPPNGPADRGFDAFRRWAEQFGTCILPEILREWVKHWRTLAHSLRHCGVREAQLEEASGSPRGAREVALNVYRSAFRLAAADDLFLPRDGRRISPREEQEADEEYRRHERHLTNHLQELLLVAPDDFALYRAAADSLFDRVTQNLTGGQRRWTKVQANAEAMRLAEADPAFVNGKAGDWAEAIGCSTGLVAKLPF